VAESNGSSSDVLEKYLALVEKRPAWFANAGESGEIKIITDKDRILAEQSRIRSRLIAAGKPASWIEIGVLAEDEWHFFVRDMVEFPDGRVGGYTRLINRTSGEGGTGVVLVCVREDSVLLIRKFRHERRGWDWEFPRGFGEPGVPALEMARTELREEIGVIEAEFTLLASMQEGLGGTAVFQVDLPKDVEINLDFSESIVDHRWLLFSELDQLVIEGQVRDWHTLWSYMVLKLNS
jgi:ADP-ribose pyrophosphatase